MRAMVAQAVRTAIAGRGRFVLTGLAIMLSVAFLTATLVLSDSMRGRAADDVARAFAATDAVVQGVALGESDGGPGELGGSVRRSMPADVVDRAAAVDGVAGVAPQWIGFAKLVVDGASVGTGTATDVGRNWVEHPTLNPFVLDAGRPPAALGEIAVDRGLARAAGVALDDRVEVLTATGMHEATVVGIATFAGADAAPLQRTVLLAAPALDPWLDVTAPTEVLVDVAADRTADADAVVASLRTALSDAEVVRGADHVAAMQVAATSPLQFLTVFLLAFAVIAVLIGVTIIFNTFALTVARRRRESGLLRAVGASRRQVLGGVLVEAVVIGVTATAAGVALGVAGVGLLRWLVGLTGVTLLTGPSIVAPRSLVIAAAVGLCATLLAAWLPARRAAATAPVEAMRDSAAEPRRVGRVRTVTGVVLGVLAIAGGVMAVVQTTATWLAVTALVVPALVLCGPVIVTGAARAVDPLARRGAGACGAIAAGNLAASPRRASSTALALMLGTAMVAMFAIVASSLRTAVGTDVREGLRADLVVTSATTDFPTIDPTLAGRLASLPEVDAVAALAVAEGVVAGESTAVGGIDPLVLPRLFDLDTVAGDLSGLADGGIAVVGTDPALLGTTMVVEFERSTLAAPVVAVVGRSTGGFDAPATFVDRSVLDDAVGGLLDTLVFVAASDAAQGSDAVRGVVRDTPGSFLSTRAEHIANSGSEVAAFRSFIDGMLALAGLIALLGVANTTALAVSERSGEIGLLRSIGTTRREIRRIVRLEASLLSCVAAGLGTVVAVGFGWVLIDVAGGTDLPSVVVPWTRLGVTFVVAVVAGTLAAAWPAWRVSRRPALELVGSDR